MKTETEKKPPGLDDPRGKGPKPPFKARDQGSTGREAEMSPPPDFGEATYQGHGRLAERVALITGADSGIGRAVALAFAREGADIAIGFLENDDDANETARHVREAGRRALLVRGDIADDRVCERIVAQTVRELGHLDILVNNAAYQGPSVQRLEDIDAERVKRTVLTNIAGLLNMVRHSLPHLRPGAAIINSASIQAYQPKPAIIDYASTKGAIVTLTKGLGVELIKRGIRVNCVAPGPVWTPIVAHSFDAKELETFGAANPMGRPAQPAELAPTYVFLASNDSGFINSEVVGVTGGVFLS